MTWTHFLLSPVALQAEGSSTASSGSQLAEGKGNQIGTVQPIPCLLSMPTRNHMDITTPPLPPVAPEVLRVAEHRHKKGLMYPYIFHVLTKVCPGAVHVVVVSQWSLLWGVSLFLLELLFILQGIWNEVHFPLSKLGGKRWIFISIITIKLELGKVFIFLVNLTQNYFWNF